VAIKGKAAKEVLTEGARSEAALPPLRSRPNSQMFDPIVST
jgi:hypothetical protein